VALVGILGDAYLVFFSSPAKIENLVAFFGLVFLSVSSLAALFFHWLRERFRVGVSYKSEWPTAIRRGGGMGLLAVICGILQLNHVLNWVYALFILTALILVEIFVAVRS